MNPLRARRGLVFAALLASASVLWTCGGKVVLDGEYTSGGEGGAANGSSISSVSSVSSTTAASTGTGLMCTEESCSGLGTTECGCLRTCGSATLQVKCAPNENKKLQCICSYDDVFSGACFETEPSLSCNMDKGCCAKYFQGI